MPVRVIDTLKQKNGLSFPIVEAIDVFVEGYSSLADAVSHFATDAMVASVIANIQAQIDQLITPVTQDAEVQNARVDADGVTYTTLKARIDADQVKIKQISESPNLLGCTDPVEKTENGVDESIIGSTVSLNGTASAGYSFTTYFGGKIPTPNIENGETVTLSCRIAGGSVTGNVYCSLNNAQGTSFRIDQKESVTFTWNSSVHTALTFYINNAVVFSGAVLHVQLEKGNVATPFVEYGDLIAVDLRARDSAQKAKDEITSARTSDAGTTYATIGGRISAIETTQNSQNNVISQISESPNLLGCTNPIDKTENGIHQTFDNSVMTLDGTASAATSLTTYFGGRIPTPAITDGDTVTLSCRIASGSITGNVYCSLNNAEGTMFRLDVKDHITFTWNSDSQTALTLYINDGVVISNAVLHIQLEKGSAATPFIQYNAYRVNDIDAKNDIADLQNDAAELTADVHVIQDNVYGASTPVSKLEIKLEPGSLDVNTGFSGQSDANLISSEYIPIKGRAYYTVSWKSDIVLLCKLQYFGYNPANGRVDNTNWLDNETRVRSFKDYTQYALIEFKAANGDPISLSDISDVTITGDFDNRETVDVQKWISEMQQKAKIQSGTFIEGFHSPSGVSAITVIKNWIYLFSYNTDDTHTETITGYKYKLDSFGRITGEFDTFTFNVGHANTVDYCEATDCLIVGNGGNSSNTQPNQIYIFPNASTLSSFDVTSENCITIDVSQEGWGKQLNVIWGDDSFSNHNVIYCLTNYQQGNMEAYDQNNVDEFEGESKRFIRKVLLGMTNANAFDGTYEVLETYEYAFDESENNNDTCFYNGKIYESIIKRADGFPYIETSFENFGKDIERKKKLVPLYRSSGAVIETEFEGMCIYNGIMYIANGNNVYLLGV